MDVKDWSPSASGNVAAPPDGAPETTMKIKHTNDVIREMMAAVRREWGDTNGSVVIYKGGGNDYYGTLNKSIGGYYDGLVVRCHPNAGLPSAGMWLSFNGLPLKQVVYTSGAQLRGGELTGATIEVIYKAWSDTFYLVSAVNVEAQPPVGTTMLFWATSAPLGWVQDFNSFWLDRLVQTGHAQYAGGTWVISGLWQDAHGHNVGVSGATAGSNGNVLNINPQLSSPSVTVQLHNHSHNFSASGGADAQQPAIHQDGGWRPQFSSWIVCGRSY